jgi:hypothetical protein
MITLSAEIIWVIEITYDVFRWTHGIVDDRVKVVCHPEQVGVQCRMEQDLLSIADWLQGTVVETWRYSGR